MFGGAEEKRSLRVLPQVTLDNDSRAIDPDHIERIDLASAARRRCGARLNDKCRMTADLVACGRASRVADVKVAGEQYVDAAAGEGRHRHARPSDQMPVVVTGGQIEWMMRDNDLGDTFAQRREAAPHARQLVFADPPSLERQRARGVDAQYRNLIVGKERLQVASNVAPVFVERLQHSAEHIVQLHIMIAGHHDLRRWQRVEKTTGLPKLLGTRTLRKVPRNANQVGFYSRDQLDKRFDQRMVDATEMEVRQVNKGAHARLRCFAYTAPALRSPGTMTRNAPGRTR